MGPQPKFIYFDLDDTLLDHKQAEREALRDIHGYFDLFNPVSAAQLITIYQQVSSEQWARYSRAEIDRDQLQRKRFELTLLKLELDDSRYEQVGSRYMQYYQNHWTWISGARQVFERIKENFEVGILTNGFTQTQKLKFEQLNLYNQTEHLVISEELGELKPHPAVFAHATNLAGCRPDEILYIGDSYRSDVIGGTEFGWKVAWYTQSGETKKRQKADFVFDDFKDLRSYMRRYKGNKV